MSDDLARIVAERVPGSILVTAADRDALPQLCERGEVLVFSGGRDNERGCTYPPSYWAKQFARYDYRPYDLLRDQLWWDQRIDWWHRQNVLVFAPGEQWRERGWVLPRTTKPRSLDLAQPALVMPELRRRLNATVCIPWRPSPSRLAAFARVQEYWAMFGWPVVTADSNTTIFSLAQARNNAVRKAKTEVVVIADADTLPMPLLVLKAVAEPDGVCWPFNRYRIISQDYLHTPLEQLATVPHINTWDGAGIAGVGGCLVCTRREYWRLGGQPPEFIGWGWEDTAFTMVVRTLSTAKRLRGNVYAFEHNTYAESYTHAKADSPGWDRDTTRNQHLMAPYLNADSRPWLMRAVVEQKAREHAAGVSPAM
jgi:hypothetical protein